ncbi:hypothetical protein FH972_017977 [Carpinus fangiana]|uniref:Uncharacterized protein n=1 Tax=Carpinus fangiana TaxID=176857 RepID=A0A5N6RKS9_9ROSI|nr:hypothetical protein FH972_017977 [Carpinus fangiana]
MCLLVFPFLPAPFSVPLLVIKSADNNKPCRCRNSWLVLQDSTHKLLYRCFFDMLLISSGA